MTPLWIFGYGSLIWHPGFEPAEVRPALLHGWHRRFCNWSHNYRGTPERPGLMLGLDRGGACRGMAFRVREAERREVLLYLMERELDNGIYEPRRLPAATAGGPLRPLAFVVDRGHPAYAGQLPEDAIVEVLATGRGTRGSARDYLANLVAHLDAAGLPDRRLTRLLAAVDARRARLPPPDAPSPPRSTLPAP